MVDSLSPTARALLLAARSAVRATEADRERIAEALRDRLGKVSPTRKDRAVSWLVKRGRSQSSVVH